MTPQPAGSSGRPRSPAARIPVGTWARRGEPRVAKRPQHFRLWHQRASSPARSRRRESAASGSLAFGGVVKTRG